MSATSGKAGGLPKWRIMITRIWRGWTSLEHAPHYEVLLTTEIFPSIARRKIDGYLGISLLKRKHNIEIEFVTIMWFTDLSAVRRFSGDDYEIAVVPAKARALLSRFDERSAHYETLRPPFSGLDASDSSS